MVWCYLYSGTDVGVAEYTYTSGWGIFPVALHTPDPGTYLWISQCVEYKQESSQGFLIVICTNNGAMKFLLEAA